MVKDNGFKTAKKFFVVLLSILALLIAAVFLINREGEVDSSLTEAVEGGESALTAISKSHESLMNFVDNKEETAADILKTAKTSQEYSKKMLTSARDTREDFVLKMTENYEVLLNSSHVMTQGIDNLLAVSPDLEKTLNYYRQGAYEKASEKASVCLQTLTPLIDEFEQQDRNLNRTDFLYVAAGHKDPVKHAVTQYKDEMRIYSQYILLLEVIKEGKDYLEVMNTIKGLFSQLQHELANKNYENVKQLLREILEKLQCLNGSIYQDAAHGASELDPSVFNGIVYNVALDLQNQLKGLGGILGFEIYLESLEEYVEAMNLFDQGNLEAANGKIGTGRSLLGSGNPSDAELQNYYSGLQDAFNSLEMQIRGQEDQG